jgi:hypothetical protein
LHTLQTYIDTATDNRSSDTSIVQVAAGSEPAMFTQHFRGWDAELFERNTFVDPFEAKMAVSHSLILPETERSIYIDDTID